MPSLSQVRINVQVLSIENEKHQEKPRKSPKQPFPVPSSRFFQRDPPVHPSMPRKGVGRAKEGRELAGFKTRCGAGGKGRCVAGVGGKCWAFSESGWNRLDDTGVSQGYGSSGMTIAIRGRKCSQLWFDCQYFLLYIIKRRVSMKNKIPSVRI